MRTRASASVSNGSRRASRGTTWPRSTRSGRASDRHRDARGGRQREPRQHLAVIRQREDLGEGVPDPVNSCSARAGLNVIATCWPPVSSSAGSAIATDGMNRDNFDRSHGMSCPLGFRIESTPMAPAFFRNSQRVA